MQYRKFLEWDISALGLGNMRLPTTGPRGPIAKEKAIELIRYAYDHGINYFDTAYRYHEGESEIVVGEALACYPRESWHLASKMPGHMLAREPDGRFAFTGFPDKKVYFDSLKDVFEEQLRKCGVDYFDMYLLHNLNENSVDFYMDKEIGVVDYLLEEKKNGRIKHIGFSAHAGADTIKKFLDTFDGVFEAVQIQINYMDWTVQDAAAKYELLTSRGIPIISMESVRGGGLANLPENAAEILKKADPNATQASWALRWLQAKPGVRVVLSGMTTMEQLKENLALFENPSPLTEDESAVLRDVVDILTESVPCTACSYCTEGCPQGLNIPSLIALYNNAKLSLRSTYHPRGMKPEELPSACIGCGACASACPQGIDIPDVLKKFAAMIPQS